ncbi:MAG: hypothetical protein HZA51_06075 [Planctomycetes bacterium]|nr:hypothetical protein [Planctomycetota bacterium]
MIHTNKVLVSVVAYALASPLITHAGIIVDQPPSQYFGSASDTAFYNEFGLLRWQQLADDFMLEADASIHQLTWWAFYGGIAGSSLDPPLGDETLLVRLYTERPMDGLPGLLMREITVVNAERVATGRRVGVMGSPAEYRFDLPLAAPFEAVGGTRYWLSFQQIGLSDSLFRWQFTTATINGYALQNANVSGWAPILPADLAFQLHDTPEPSTLMLVSLLVALAAKCTKWRYS